MSKTYSLEIVSAVIVAGVPVPAGTIVHDVDEGTARRLLDRGKAELATAEDLEAAPSEPVADAPAEGGTSNRKAAAAAKKEGEK